MSCGPVGRRHYPIVDIAPTTNRLRPLHVLVRHGVPGEHRQIAVAGTPTADAVCSAGVVTD